MKLPFLPGKPARGRDEKPLRGWPGAYTNNRDALLTVATRKDSAEQYNLKP